MTDDEALFHYTKLTEIYGDSLPDMFQEPIRFAYFVKLYRYFDLPRILNASSASGAFHGSQ